MAFILRELLASAEKQLANSNSARLDAEVLLSFVLKTSREILYSHPDKPVADNFASDFQSLVAKRANGFPVAYLLGHKEFWSKTFTVNRHTLIPRPETECLVETALELIPARSDLKILDLGTGSGAIAISVATERPDCSITATDVMEDSLHIARSNAMEHQASNIRFKQSDWFSNLVDEVFDIILCNPPYIDSQYTGFLDSEIRFEPRLALDGGYRGIEIINNLVPSAAYHLTSGGYLILEHGYDQGGSVRDLFLTNRFTDIRTRNDYAGIERISFARLP